MYFSNPVPMFRGDPRRPWIDISSEKIVQRHLGMTALQSYMNMIGSSLDAIPAIDFLDNHMHSFSEYLLSYKIDKDDILVPIQSQNALYNYSIALEDSLNELKQKRNTHPELFETENGSNLTQKSLLDALYEEGIIPTYSFPKLSVIYL